MIRNYFNGKLALLSLIIIIMFSYCLIMLLSGCKSELTIYAFFLSAFISLMFLALDYAGFVRKTKALAELKKNLGLDIGAYPPPKGYIEQLYHEIIQDLYSLTAKWENAQRYRQDQTRDYFTMWVHQIKTPIAAMQLVLESQGDEKGILSAELFKISSYAEMALSFVKIDDIYSDKFIEKCSLDDMVRCSVKKFSTLFITKGLYVNFTPCGKKLVTDKKWFCFIMEQMLSNAVKYTQTGGVDIFCRDDSLFIRDTGIGIKSYDIPRAFEKGYTGFNGRLNNTSSGLGLFMAQKAAEQLSLKLSLSECADKGTLAQIDFSLLTKM